MGVYSHVIPIEFSGRTPKSMSVELHPTSNSCVFTGYLIED